MYCDTLISKNPDYAIVNIYTVKTDAGYTQEGDEVDQEYSLAHPGPLFDRFRFPFRTGIVESFYSGMQGFGLSGYKEREHFFEPVQVYIKSASFNETKRQLKVIVGAKFFDNLSGDYRFNLYVTEDEIKAYQAEAPDPNNYYHKRVLRAMVGGAWGKQGSLPATLSKDDYKEYEFNYTIPAGYNTNKMRLIGMVQEYSSDKYKRRIANSHERTLKQAVGINGSHAVSNTAMQIYPNPASGNVTIAFGNNTQQYAIAIVDMSGRVVYSGKASGKAAIDITKLTAGQYLVRADDGQVVQTQQLVVQ
jgi:hypothetical protein